MNYFKKGICFLVFSAALCVNAAPKFYFRTTRVPADGFAKPGECVAFTAELIKDGAPAALPFQAQLTVEGKDVIIIDDMISSGDSIIDVATELKRRKANRIFAAATFGLFTNGLDKFDKAYEDGIITGILTTNLIYQTPELLSKPYYINCDMSKYIALIIDTLNHDGSLSSILSPNERIQNVLRKYKAGEPV